MLIYEEMEVRPHLFAPAVRLAEIPELARICQSVVFNSLSEYERHYETFRSANPDILFGLRVNPGYSEIETDLYDPAGPGSRLGQMELDEIPDRSEERRGGEARTGGRRGGQRRRQQV